MLIGHAADERAVRKECDVHGRKGKNCIHHIRSRSTNSEKRRDMACPQGEVVGVEGSELVVQRSHMVDQAQILKGVQVRERSRVDSQRREWEYASVLPVLDGCLNLRRPHQVGLVRSGRPLGVVSLDIVVRTTDLVLGTVAALGKALVTSNVPTFTGLASLAGLGVAASRRTAAGTSHCRIRSEERSGKAKAKGVKRGQTKTSSC